MRIKSKLLVIYIPILLIGMTLTGYWAYLTAYDSVREREYQLLTQTLTLNVLEIIDERRELLIESGLENVPVFREAYQKEVFEELKSLTQSPARYLADREKSGGPWMLEWAGTNVVTIVAAGKEAQANVIRRREETQATRSLLNTAKVMQENPVMLRLKELEALTELAGKVERLTVHNGTQGLMNDLVQLRE